MYMMLSSDKFMFYVLCLCLYRFQWTRVHVVKLFIEHVCTLQNKDDSSNRCMSFWVVSIIVVLVVSKMKYSNLIV